MHCDAHSGAGAPRPVRCAVALVAGQVAVCGWQVITSWLDGETGDLVFYASLGLILAKVAWLLGRGDETTRWLCRVLGVTFGSLMGLSIGALVALILTDPPRFEARWAADPVGVSLFFVAWLYTAVLAPAAVGGLLSPKRVGDWFAAA